MDKKEIKLVVPEDIEGKEAETIEPKTQTASFGGGAKAIAALSALGISAYDDQGKEKKVSEILDELKKTIKAD